MKNRWLSLIFFILLFGCGVSEENENSTKSEGLKNFQLGGYWNITIEVTINESFYQGKQTIPFTAKMKQTGTFLSGTAYFKPAKTTSFEEAELINISVSKTGVLKFEIPKFIIRKEAFTFLENDKEEVKVVVNGQISSDSNKIEGNTVLSMSNIKTTMGAFAASAVEQGTYVGTKTTTPDPSKFPAGAIDSDDTTTPAK